MEIGVVVHGPGIIDSGYALKIINLLSDYGNVRCRLGGTMGRTAVIDASLEDKIDISLKLLPSESLELFNRDEVDVIFLLDYGKSAITGQVFGYKVFTHYFKKISNEDFLATNHKPLYDSKIPVIQIERPGEEDGSIISWNVVLNEQLLNFNKKNRFNIGKSDMVDALTFNFEEFFYGIADALNLKKIGPEEVISQYFSESIEKNDKDNIEEILKNYSNYENANYTYRKIHGASPNENIILNGVVVGYTHSDNIVLIAEDGIIVDILGGEIKQHGVDKLGPVDLNGVIVKTGLLRKSDDIKPRILNNNQINIGDHGVTNSDDENSSFKVAFVDHAAYDIYRFKDCDLVLTIGDDTSLVASDILYRFNIPIIGITDGDLDKVVEKGFINEKSTIIEVASGFDDIVGKNIHDVLFESNQILEYTYSQDYGSVSEFKNSMFDIFKSHVFDAVKEIVPTFIERTYDSNPNEYYSNSSIEENISDLEDVSVLGIIDSSIESSDSFEDLNDDYLKDDFVDIHEVDNSLVSDDLNSNDVEFTDLDDKEVLDNLEDFEFVDINDLEEDVIYVDKNSEDVIYTNSNDNLSNEIVISSGEDILYKDSVNSSDDDYIYEDDVLYDDSVNSSDDDYIYEDDVLYDDSVNNSDKNVFYENDVVYVDSEGNEIILEEGVVYVDSEGNEFTSEDLIDNSSNLVYDDSFDGSFDGSSDLVYEGTDNFDYNENNSQLERYNELLEDYVNEYEESLDEEFSKIYDEKIESVDDLNLENNSSEDNFVEDSHNSKEYLEEENSEDLN